MTQIRASSLTPRGWIDGGARGNPGEAGFAAVIEPQPGGAEVVEIGGYLGHSTNNVAEYAGLLAALTWAVAHRIEGLQLYSDSLLLVRQLEGAYKVKAPHLQPLHRRAVELKRRLPGLKVSHVRREFNKQADALANRAIDERMPLPDWLKADLAELL
jgi:ribonuclease HI